MVRGSGYGAPQPNCSARLEYWCGSRLAHTGACHAHGSHAEGRAGRPLMQAIGGRSIATRVKIKGERDLWVAAKPARYAGIRTRISTN